VGLKVAPTSAVILRMKNDYPTKITFGEMRETGATRIIVFSKDYRCSHNVQMDALRWPDQVRISDVEARFVCTVCGKRGSNIRSADQPPRMGTRR
jgi:hypothetical protein